MRREVRLTLEWTVPTSKRHRRRQQGDGDSSNATDVTEVVDGPVRTVLLPPTDNSSRQRRTHARKTLEFCLCRPIHIHQQRCASGRPPRGDSRHVVGGTGVGSLRRGANWTPTSRTRGSAGLGRAGLGRASLGRASGVDGGYLRRQGAVPDRFVGRAAHQMLRAIEFAGEPIRTHGTHPAADHRDGGKKQEGVALSGGRHRAEYRRPVRSLSPIRCRSRPPVARDPCASCSITAKSVAAVDLVTAVLRQRTATAKSRSPPYSTTVD